MSEITSVTLAVDSRQVRTATADLKRFGEQGGRTERAARSLSTAFNRIPFAAIAAGASAAAAGLGAFVQSSINAADAASKAAQSAGLTTEAYTALSFAANLSGVEANQLGLALTQLNQKINSGDKALTDYGVSLTDINGKARAADEVLLDLADEFQRLPDGAAKSARAVELFGQRVGPQLIPLLNQGRAGIEGLKKEAEQLGVVISTQTGKAAEEFNDNITRLKTSLQGLGLSIAQQVLPQLVRLSEELLVGLRNSNGLIDAITTFGTARPFANAIDGAQFYRKELNELIRRRDRLIEQEGVLANTVGFDRDIETARKRLAYFNELARNALLRANNADNESDAERRRLGLSRLPTAAPAAAGTTAAAGRPRATPIPQVVFSEADRYLEGLQRQLEATEDLTVTEALLRDIQKGRLGDVSAAQQAQLVNIAQEIDAVRTLNEITAEFRQLEEEGERKRQALLSEGQSIAESVRTEAERYGDAIERLNFLLSEGAINQDTYTRAAARARDEYSQSSNEISDLAKQQNSFGNELGLTFASAFEDAIVKGKSFKDVLRGLGEDILRITTRKFVTEPLGNLFSNFLGGINFGSLFGGGAGRAIGGPVSRGGLYEVNERGPELLNLAGRQYLMMGNNQGTVQPNSQVGGGGQMVNITVNVPIGAPKDRATALQFGRDISRQLSLAQSRNG
jgi:hypothetical protein